MATLSELLTNAQAITITLASLGSTSYRSSASIDNTTNLYLDAGVQLKIKTGASGVTATGAVYIYAYGSSDGGTTFTEGLAGSDANVVPTSPTNLKLIGVINAVANATTYVGGPFSVAAAFGYLPGKWGIVVSNQTGAVFDATEGSFLKIFEAIRGTSA